jgi:hypothetical protein
MVYLESDNGIYLFGGCGATSGRLADLHRFDLSTGKWRDLGKSTLLRGRGGPCLLPLDGGRKLAVVAGFAGEETNDGHIYDVAAGKWEAAPMEKLRGLRPRSVCASASFPELGACLVFGGEVDPSERGHEGAGGFANDVVVLDGSTGDLLETVPAPPPSEGGSASFPWPDCRGWSDAAAAAFEDEMYMFGGLSGDDANPRRLDDLWRLVVRKS